MVDPCFFNVLPNEGKRGGHIDGVSGGAVHGASLGASCYPQGRRPSAGNSLPRCKTANLVKHQTEYSFLGDRSIPGPPDAKRQKMETRTDDKKKANRENPAKRVDLKKNPIDVDKDGQREKKSGKTAAAPESSSSSDSSSEEEESTGVNVATEKKSEVVKESSSSDSDSESESEEEEEGKLKKTVSTAQLHSTPSLAKQPPKAKSCSSSSDDSSSDEEESSGMKAVGIKKATGAKTSLKTGTEAAQAAAKSSSSSSSSEEEEEKDVSKSKPLKWQPVAKGTCSENGESEQGKKKRKRKRKPKNKNKLSPDQMPDYGPPIQVCKIAVSFSFEHNY